MPADREEIAGQRAKRLDLLAEGLGGVNVEESLRVRQENGDFRDGLKNARLVVRMHDGDEERVGPKTRVHRVGLDIAASW